MASACGGRGLAGQRRGDGGRRGGGGGRLRGRGRGGVVVVLAGQDEPDHRGQRPPRRGRPRRAGHAGAARAGASRLAGLRAAWPRPPSARRRSPARIRQPSRRWHATTAGRGGSVGRSARMGVTGRSDALLDLLERVAERGGGPEPLVGILGHRHLDRRGRRGRASPAARRSGSGSRTIRIISRDDGLVVGARERRLAEGEGRERRPERVDVRGDRGPASLEHLGREVEHRAEERARRGVAAVDALDHRGHAEVGQLALAGRRRRSTFSGLMSRWSTPARCAASSASQSCTPTPQDLGGGQRPARRAPGRPASPAAGTPWPGRGTPRPWCPRRRR